MVRERSNKNSFTKSSTRLFREFKSFLSYKKTKSIKKTTDVSNHHQFNQRQEDVGIAVTLSTEIKKQPNEQCISLLDPKLNFLSNQPMSSSFILLQNKAYVHYEPQKSQVTLGTHPTIKHIKSCIVLKVEHYAWLIQQLQEEQNITHYLNQNYQNSLYSPMLGVLMYPSASSDTSSTTTSQSTLGKRLIRFVQQRKRDKNFHLVTPSHRRQCIFMLPKILLLQAATHIPVAKPLPPLQTIPIRKPFEPITDSLYQTLRRYSNHISLCTHELLSTQTLTSDTVSPPSSLASKTNNPECVKIQCADCPRPIPLETLIQQPQPPVPQQSNDSNIISSTISQKLNSIMTMTPSIMFPVSYVSYTSTTAIPNLHPSPVPSHEHVFLSSAVQTTPKTHARSIFDSLTRKQKPHAFSAFQYIPPDRTLSSGEISSLSECSAEPQDEPMEPLEDGTKDQDIFTPQKYGYVALDNEHEEILVVFPGMPLSHNMFENASFRPVPWLEVETILSIPPLAERKQPQQNFHQVEEDVNPWVLESALTAWHRCEMKVVTLLMRLCATLPAHYKVVILGHSLGGAVAALCASSLRSTKLLLNRSITVCAVHSPRVGNKSFLNTLSYQKVDTIRLTHPKDPMAHLPPRTSGLLHLGDTTVILPSDDQQDLKGYTLQQMKLNQMEDILNKTFPFKDFDTQSNIMTWDIRLDDNDTQCI